MVEIFGDFKHEEKDVLVIKVCLDKELARSLVKESNKPYSDAYCQLGKMVVDAIASGKDKLDVCQKKEQCKECGSTKVVSYKNGKYCKNCGIHF